MRSFLRYQLTAYPFADPELHRQMRDLLSLDRTRRSPLLKGPYVSLLRPFRDGAPVSALVDEGLLHPHLHERIPDNITHLRSHQEVAIRAIAGGANDTCLYRHRLRQDRVLPVSHAGPPVNRSSCLRFASRRRIPAG